ncbi:MAG: hypothetical protein ACI33P_00505 [Lysinibacillus sp.]
MTKRQDNVILITGDAGHIVISLNTANHCLKAIRKRLPAKQLPSLLQPTATT